MTLTDITTNPPTNIKLDLVLIEDGVAWFENIEEGLTADVPVKHYVNGKDFEFTKDSETYWCFHEEYGYHLVSKDKNKVLTLSMEQTDEGFEIQDTHVLNIVQTH